ncbi:MAG: TetR/AcrR family transcriptional regulator [Chitinophagaceae bacterium]|nr:MAG: TetR/AcrR family transcriptional regulator [Chitinophagaceae bacterium]
MAKRVKDETSEEKILEAARKVFLQKGMDGARMQEIADEAGINKALLHYYFRNKEMLFDRIFLQAAEKLFPKIGTILNADLPLFEKIETFIASYIDVMSENPYLPLFVLNEVNRDPESFYKRISGQLKFPRPEQFLLQIDQEVKAGKIKPISPMQLLMNILSTTIFPFVAKPLFQIHIGVDEFQFRQFILQRKTELSRFIIDAIKK